MARKQKTRGFTKYVKLSEQPGGLKQLTDEELSYWIDACAAEAADADAFGAAKGRRYWNEKQADAAAEQERRTAE